MTDLRKVQFTRDTDPYREGGPGYKAGDIAFLKPASAERWIRRSAAVAYVPPAEPQPALAPVVPLTVTLDDLPNGDTLGSAEDVGGQDGGDTGDRAESDSATSQPRRRGRPPKNSGQ